MAEATKNMTSTESSAQAMEKPSDKTLGEAKGSGKPNIENPTLGEAKNPIVVVDEESDSVLDIGMKKGRIGMKKRLNPRGYVARLIRKYENEKAKLTLNARKLEAFQKKQRESLIEHQKLILELIDVQRKRDIREAENAKAQEELKMLRELVYKKNSQGKRKQKMLNNGVDSQVQPINWAPPSDVDEKVDDKPNQAT